MELGQKLKQVRLELGLSQRQLCADGITRNMLSLIENGSASPSIETLRYLAARLDKPVSYFLDEEVVSSPNQMLMEAARAAFACGHYDQVVHELEDFCCPDQTFEWEEALLRSLALMRLAEEAMERGKEIYAIELLEQTATAGERTPYYTEELERQRLLLRAKLLPTELPVDDRELLLRAEEALKKKDPEAAARYLEAAQVRSGSYWSFLRGKTYLSSGDYTDARIYLEAGWEYAPKEGASMLEQCCRELEDYKAAYYYACFLRDQT